MTARDLYLDLVKRALRNTIYSTELNDLTDQGAFEGRGWLEPSMTMIGQFRLDNVQRCVERALEDGVPGDLAETGVWRGGACILMKAVLQAFNVHDRRVWCCDSFRGLPPPDPERYPADRGFDLSGFAQLAVPRAQVEENFRKFGLLDENVRFLEGWFRDTLPSAPIKRLAVLRLDGDLYESTMDALIALEPKVSSRGFVIIDDYGAVDPCRQAVEEYRNTRAITAPLERIDWTGVYWRKP